MNTCPRCGKPVAASDAFCGTCGRALTLPATAAEPTLAAVPRGRPGWVVPAVVLIVLAFCIVTLSVSAVLLLAADSRAGLLLGLPGSTETATGSPGGPTGAAGTPRPGATATSATGAGAIAERLAQRDTQPLPTQVPIPPDQLLGGPANAAAAQTLAADLRALGLSGPGIRVLVLPVAQTNESQAIITIREATGPTPTPGPAPGQDAFARTLVNSAATRDANITRFNFDIRDPRSGQPLALISFPTAALQEAAQGRISGEELLRRSIIQVNRAALPTPTPGRGPTALPKVPTATAPPKAPTAVPKLPTPTPAAVPKK